MCKRGRTKYFLVFILCFFILSYGFIKINLTKSKYVRKESKFTIDFRLKPIDLRIETADYVFYVNNNFFDKVKEKYNGMYNKFFSK